MTKEKVRIEKSNGDITEFEADSVVIVSLTYTSDQGPANVRVINAVSSQEVFAYMIGELLNMVHNTRSPEMVLDILGYYKAAVEDQEQEGMGFQLERPKEKITYHFERGGQVHTSVMETIEIAMDCAKWDYEDGGATGDTNAIKIVWGKKEYSIEFLAKGEGWTINPRKKPRHEEEIATNFH